MKEIEVYTAGVDVLKMDKKPGYLKNNYASDHNARANINKNYYYSNTSAAYKESPIYKESHTYKESHYIEDYNQEKYNQDFISVDNEECFKNMECIKSSLDKDYSAGNLVADLVCPSCKNIYSVDPENLPPDTQVRCFVCKCVWLPIRDISVLEETLAETGTAADIIVSTQEKKSGFWRSLLFIGSLFVLGIGLLLMNEDSGVFIPLQKSIILQKDIPLKTDEITNSAEKYSAGKYYRYSAPAPDRYSSKTSDKYNRFDNSSFDSEKLGNSSSNIKDDSNSQSGSNMSYLEVKILNTDTSGRELKKVILNFPHGQEVVYINTYLRPGGIYTLKYPLSDRYAKSKIIPEMTIL